MPVSPASSCRERKLLLAALRGCNRTTALRDCLRVLTQANNEGSETPGERSTCPHDGQCHARSTKRKRLTTTAVATVVASTTLAAVPHDHLSTAVIRVRPIQVPLYPRLRCYETGKRRPPKTPFSCLNMDCSYQGALRDEERYNANGRATTRKICEKRARRLWAMSGRSATASFSPHCAMPDTLVSVCNRQELSNEDISVRTFHCLAYSVTSQASLIKRGGLWHI